MLPKNFHGLSDICLMGFINSIRNCEISHQTFGSSHRKCPTCPMIFVNTGIITLLNVHVTTTGLSFRLQVRMQPASQLSPLEKTLGTHDAFEVDIGKLVLHVHQLVVSSAPLVRTLRLLDKLHRYKRVYCTTGQNGRILEWGPWNGFNPNGQIPERPLCWRLTHLVFTLLTLS